MFGLGKNGLIVSLSRCKNSVERILRHVSPCSLFTACVLHVTAIQIAHFDHTSAELVKHLPVHVPRVRTRELIEFIKRVGENR